MVIFCVKANGDNKDGLFSGLEGVGEVILVMGTMEDRSHLTDHSVS